MIQEKLPSVIIFLRNSSNCERRVPQDNLKVYPSFFLQFEMSLTPETSKTEKFHPILENVMFTFIVTLGRKFRISCDQEVTQKIFGNLAYFLKKNNLSLSGNKAITLENKQLLDRFSYHKKEEVQTLLLMCSMF